MKANVLLFLEPCYQPDLQSTARHRMSPLLPKIYDSMQPRTYIRHHQHYTRLIIKATTLPALLCEFPHCFYCHRK